MNFTKPALVLDEGRVRRNIERMAAKADGLGLRFRPHFKTHQSRSIGRIFRERGVEAITVSSVDMAAYFAADGWRDILIAFPLNILELAEIRRLAARVRLGLLVESTDGLAALAAGVGRPVDVWIKVDIGAHRAGLDWNDRAALARVCGEVSRRPKLRLRGLLTHNGRTYAARTLASLKRATPTPSARCAWPAGAWRPRDSRGSEISVGDTPACSRLDDFSGVDEIRPGNFVLHDVTQIELGSCRERDVAAAVACPVVAVHASRREVVVYGGAIHLSKEDFVSESDGRIYGRVSPAARGGLGTCLEGHGRAEPFSGTRNDRDDSRGDRPGPAGRHPFRPPGPFLSRLSISGKSM
ncbi:MAG: alanine racemase [Candidatus Moduliflexus flocculans]|nr:alanine racemase [Candidatus Moduliflexus flocculans]